MASDSWFYSDGGNSFGPVAEETIQSLIADGTIGAAHFVMPEGEDDWTVASESTFGTQFKQIWYHSDGKETYGPVPESTLREIIESGDVKPDHYVMCGSETDWTPLGESKFASIKIAGPKAPTGQVTAKPLRPQNTTPSPSRKKAAVHIDSDDSPPSAPNPTEAKASVPKSESAPTDKITKLTAEIETVKKESDAWMRRVAEAEKERGDALKDCQDTTKKLSVAEKNLADLNIQFDRSSTDGNLTRKEADKLREDLSTTENKFLVQLKAKGELEERIAELQNQLASDGKPVPENTIEAQEKAKRLSSELVETSTLLAAAKERSTEQTKKITQLESDLEATLARVGEIEASKAEGTVPAPPTGAADQKRVWTLEKSLADTQNKLALAEHKLKSTASPAPSPHSDSTSPAIAKSAKLPWTATLAALALAAIAGAFAWSEHRKATAAGDADLPGKITALEADLSTANDDLAETRENLERARSTETSTGEHAAFTSTLLDRIAAQSGPIDPDFIAEMRRETEKQFGLSEKTDPRDGETAKRAAEKIAKGDDARSAKNHEEALNFYRDAALMLAPLLEKYPSKSFWRGDLLTAHTRHSRQELKLGNYQEADAALAMAESQFKSLQKDDPERAAVRTGELADAWESLADNAAKIGDIDRAQNGFARALQHHTALAPRKDSPAHTTLHKKLADVAIDAAKWTTAESHLELANAGISDPREIAALHEKLAMVKRKLGKLPEAAQLAEKSLAHYRTTAELNPTPDTLRPLAATFNLSGEIKRDSGDLPGAATDHAQAQAVYENILTAQPDDPESKRGLAISGVRAGEVEMAQKNYEAARTRFQENLPTLRMLTEPDFTDIRALKDLEYVHLNIARSHAMENNHESALAAYAEALRASELLADAAPKNLIYALNLASWKTRVANYQTSLGKAVPARENLQDALRIYKILSANSEGSDPDITQKIADLNKSLGDLEMAIVPDVAITPEVIEDPVSPTDPVTPESPTDPTPPIATNEGESYYNEAITAAKTLSAQYPDDPKFKRDIADAHEKLVIFLLTGSRIPDALAELQKSLAIRTKIVDDAEIPEPLWFYELSRIHYQIGYITSQTNASPAVGQQHYIAALQHGENAVQATDAAGQAVPAEWIAQNGETYLRLAEIDQFERQFFPARRRFIRAVEILRRLIVTHTNGEWRMSFVLACRGLAINYELGDPKDPSLAKNLYNEGLQVLKKMESSDQLLPEEKGILTDFEEWAKR